MFFFELIGMGEGHANTSIIAKSGDRKFKINIGVKVMKLYSVKDGYKLNANVWGYLYKPMLKDRKTAAAKDMEEHHINTIVIPPWFIPNNGSHHYQPLLRYLHHFKGIKNILLRIGYNRVKNRNHGGTFMSTRWKANFVKWYANVVKLIHNNGFPDAKIYLYPYDEPRTKKNINDFVRLIKWAKGAVPGINFFPP